MNDGVLRDHTNKFVESKKQPYASLPRDVYYEIAMRLEPLDILIFSNNTNRLIKNWFFGSDERTKGFRANYVKQHLDYNWFSLREEVLLMWIDLLIENTDWASAVNNYTIRYAVQNGYVEVVRLLLNAPNRGIDPSADDNYAIESAARWGHVEVLRLLLNTPDRGIDPATKNNYAIRYAARYGHVEVVRLLLNTPGRGIDPAAKDNYAIHWAVKNGHVKVVQLLLNTHNRGIISWGT